MKFDVSNHGMFFMYRCNHRYMFSSAQVFWISVAESAIFGVVVSGAHACSIVHHHVNLGLARGS
jgi:hypothetical protein